MNGGKLERTYGCVYEIMEIFFGYGRLKIIYGQLEQTYDRSENIHSRSIKIYG
jgi:hypothetical protein